jgi:hypothetical protein
MIHSHSCHPAAHQEAFALQPKIVWDLIDMMRMRFMFHVELSHRSELLADLYTLTDLLLQCLEAYQIFFVSLMDLAGSVVRCGGFCAD